MGSFLFTLLIVLGFFLYFFLLLNHRNQKNNAIKHHQIVFVNKNKQISLPLKNYGIPIGTKKSGLVEVIFPDLDDEGQLRYHYAWYYLFELSIAKLKSDHSQSKEFLVAQELRFYIQEHLKTEKELANLDAQYHEVYKLTQLISKSDLYAHQIGIYRKALIEITKLMNKAKELDKLDINFIREGLIGIKINNYNPDNIESNLVINQTKYQQLKQEYEYMKDTAKAYGELVVKNLR